MLLKAMFPVLNFCILMYLDDVIIYFKNDKEYLHYLKKMNSKGRSGNQRYKEVHREDTGLFRDSCMNPYVMLTRENFLNFSFQELDGPRVVGDPYEDKMLKFRHFQDF